LNKKQFVLDSKSLKIKEILNKDFLEIEILAIAEGENRNETSFTLDSMKKSIPTFYNKFILGYFNVQGDVNNDGNFEEHNSDIKYDTECDEFYYSYLAPNAEKALGLIRESDKVEIVEVNGKKWIKLTAAILTKYNREAVKHLLKSKNKKKISVEITIEKSYEENGITIIEEFTLDGITILGTRKNSKRPCEEGIEGASMVLRFLQSEVYNTQKRALSFAYQELESEALNTNEEQENITMQNNETNSNTQERGTIPMLTYEQKRSLLESKLNEILRPDDAETECCYYCWVCDLDEADVYYCYKDTYYKASYSINEDESTVEINVNEAKQVTRSWKEFALEEQEETQATFVEEDVKDSEEFSTDEENTEKYSDAEDTKEEESLEDEEKECGTQCSEEVDKKETEVKDVDGEIFTEEKSDEEEKSEEVANTQECSEEEKTEEQKEVEDKEECSEEDTSEEETSKEDEEEAEDKEEYVDDVNVYKEYTLNFTHFKDNSSDDSSVEITMTMTEENYAQIVSACEETATTLETLRANYSELKAKYDEVVLAQTIEGFCAYGKELFMNEETLDIENKNSLIEQFEEKCKNNEFSSEEEIQSYAEDQIAKAVYQQVKNNKEKNNETVNFSAKIKTSTEPIEVVTEEDSMAKMKSLLKI
jgi:hypothetical protein